LNTSQNISLALLIVASALLSPARAWAGKDIVVDMPPPAPRIEHQPPHRDGYVWAPGYWEWTGRFFQWTSGTWISERRGHWVANHWDPIGNQWHYVEGHWER
jgi:hypothetical protein